MATAISMMLALVQSATAKTYKVGEETGWTIFDIPTFYDDWVAKQNFMNISILLDTTFTGQVSPADAQMCDGTKPIANPTIELTEAGEIGYICQVHFPVKV